MWTIRHLCPSGASFVLNCYRHWSSLVLCNNNGIDSFLHSKEGVTQGDPLEMIVYGFGILPLINKLKRDILDVTQTWYADDARALGTFAIIETYLNLLTCQGPGRGYYPEPSKSVLIVHPKNIKDRKELGTSNGCKVCKSARYLGGYIRDNESKRNWLR